MNMIIVINIPTTKILEFPLPNRLVYWLSTAKVWHHILFRFMKWKIMSAVCLRLWGGLHAGFVVWW